MKKYIDFLIDFLPIENKSSYYNFADIFINKPKKVYSFIPHWYIFEYLYDFYIWKIDEKTFLYLGDVISRINIYKFYNPKEDIFYINYLIQQKKISDCYILITNKTKKIWEININDKTIDLIIFD